MKKIVYKSEYGIKYTWEEVLKIAKGNAEYAQSLIDRAEWQSLETLVEEDLVYGEIKEENNTYILTGGE